MHNESPTEPQFENEDQKESFFVRNGHIIFWGAMIALPAMNLTASVIGAKTAQKNLDIATLELELEKLKSNTLK